MPIFVALLSRGRAVRPRLVLAAIAGGGGLGAVSAQSGDPVFSYAGMIASTLLTVAAHDGGAEKGAGA